MWRKIQSFHVIMFWFMGLVLFTINQAAADDSIEIPDNLIQVIKQLGVMGEMHEGTLVVRYPRSDIKVTIGGEEIPTALGLVSWTAWKDMGKQAMMMGDFVLLEKEISPFMTQLGKGNIQVTALHNHFLGETPRIMFMHIEGMGKAEVMAKTLRLALDKTSTPKQPLITVPSLEKPAFDTTQIGNIMGLKGQTSGGVFKLTQGRSGVKQAGTDLTSSMGLNSWVGFIGTNEHAHIAGDIAMSASEVNPVIRTLQAGGINIVAVHNHMLDEQPRTFFLHYWGTGNAISLARTMRTAFNFVKGPMK